MKAKLSFVLILVLVVVAAAGCVPVVTQAPALATSAPPPTAAPPTAAPTALPPTATPPTAQPTAPALTPSASATMPGAQAETASIVRGGLLYDEWWKVVQASEPEDNQPLWSLQTTNERSGSITWRCKECHGWDYKGKDGAYGSGSHETGFPGVWDAARAKTVDELVAALKGAANPMHDFSSSLQPAGLTDAANFLKYGLVDVSEFVDYATKKPIGGDVARGRTLYGDTCALCHGPEGKTQNFGSESEPEYVGTIAKDNPSEFIHKVRVGQPGSNPPMPSALVGGWTIQQVIDVLSYAQTLPEK